MRAYNCIKTEPWYRKQAFDKGLQAVGFEVKAGPPTLGMKKEDVLLIWNRYGTTHELALMAERSGATVVVAENGYLGKGGTSPKFDVHPGGPKPWHYYSLSVGWHNGRGRWPTGGPERFRALDVELKPWRENGEHILICPNRSFGVGEQVMSPEWASIYANGLKGLTKRPIRIRTHPGNNAPMKPLEEDLKNAWAVVVWSSSVACHALLEGLPTYIEAPYQVLKSASASGPIENPILPDRLPHFESMAWHQWTCEEIESGEPFRALLPAAGKS